MTSDDVPFDIFKLSPSIIFHYCKRAIECGSQPVSSDRQTKNKKNKKKKQTKTLKPNPTIKANFPMLTLSSAIDNMFK